MNTLTLRQLRFDSGADVHALRSVFMAAPAYSLLVEGTPPSPSAAEEVFAALPPGKAIVDKFVFGVFDSSGPVGCVDVIRGYPEANISFLGLMLFAEFAQGRSYGPRVLREIEIMSAGWGCTELRLAVIDSNARALAFWQREGFVEAYRKPSPLFTGRAIVMQRALTLPSSGLPSAAAHVKRWARL